MGKSWRLGFRVFLISAAAALVWFLLASPRHTRKLSTQPIEDLEVTSPLNRPGGGPVPSDSYELYSALYRAAMNEPLAFAENSEADIPQVGRSCLMPATPEEQEMADNFAAANQLSHRWETKFSIPQGYRLLSPREASKALTCLSTHMSDPVQCASYKQLRHVRWLGVPGFNRAHTRALVSIIMRYRAFRGSGGILEVEKLGSAWQRAPTTDFVRNCSWMY